MRKLCVACLTLSFLAIVQLSSVRVSGAAGSLPPLLNLAPGTDLRLQQIVDVNIVLIGFRGLVDPAAMVAVQELPLFNGVPKANGQGQTSSASGLISATTSFPHLPGLMIWFLRI